MPEAPSRPGTFGIRQGYTVRDDPAYFDDDLKGVTWQPDVYSDTARIAAAVDARRVIDVGAGDGNKLAALHPRFDIIGIDFGANVTRSRERHPFGSWREHDLDEPDVPLPLSSDELSGSVVVCADVIEHLRSPDVLLAKLRSALETASVLVLSTPERELWHGVRSLGPPRNPHHVREWTIRELEQLMRATGFQDLSVGLTRSNDRTDDPFTIEVIATSGDAAIEAIAALLVERQLPPARLRWRSRLIRAARVLRYG